MTTLIIALRTAHAEAWLENMGSRFMSKQGVAPLEGYPHVSLFRSQPSPWDHPSAGDFDEGFPFAGIYVDEDRPANHFVEMASSGEGRDDQWDNVYWDARGEGAAPFYGVPRDEAAGASRDLGRFLEERAKALDALGLGGDFSLYEIYLKLYPND